MCCNFDNFIFFSFLVILFTVTTNESHAAFFEDYVLMEKNTNGDLIFVYNSSSEKLIEWGYAKETIDFAKFCNTEIIDVNTFDSDCYLKYNEDDGSLCLDIKNSTDSCIWKFEWPETLKECKMLFKIVSVYYMYHEYSIYPDEYFISFHFNNFSYVCEERPHYGKGEGWYDFIDEKIADNFKFLFYDGKPQSVTWRSGSVNESYPPQIVGGGTFENGTHRFKFEFTTRHNEIWDLKIYCLTDIHDSESCKPFP